MLSPQSAKDKPDHTRPNTMTKLQPIGTNVLVRLDARVAQSKGGIVIPARAQKAEEWGDVAAVGKGVEALSIGDRVYVSPYIGTHYTEQGADFIIVGEEKIIAKQETQTA